MYGFNQNVPASDPSAQVPNNLLPHVHLVSSYRFAATASLQPAQALDYLIKGPQITRDTSSVAWTYFSSPPPDGTVLLTWQPPRLGTHFASDGLVWADPETIFETNIRGYSLQILIHKSGYHYPIEQFAVHARYRYRIVNGPGAFDPNLWIVHYAPADPSLRIAANQIPLPRETHAVLQTRAQLQAAGPLMRKEFMLQDSANWPKVEFAQNAARPQQPYYNPMQPGRYTAQPPPAKRQRLPAQQQARQSVPPAAGADPLLEEEENATQDSFDFMTPREISLSRYKQHHEWMEEIFSSPYSINKLLPIDLGLGLMGELAPLTAGILDAPGGEHPRVNAPGVERPGVNEKEYNVKSYTKLEPEQLKDFEKRVADHVAKEQAEIDRMKAAHAKRVADVKRTRTYIKAERRLRDLGRTSTVGEEDENPLDEVVHDLEKTLGVTFDMRKHVVCVEKGGYIEEQQPPAPKPQVNGNGNAQPNTNGGANDSSNEGGMDADNTAASLLDQYGSGSLGGTPSANLSVPQISQPASQSQSAVATPSAPTADPAQGTAFDEQTANIEELGSGNDLVDLDVEMSGMTSVEDKGPGSDWVMVDDQAPGNAQQTGTNSVQPGSTSNTVADQSVVPNTGVDTETGGSMFDTPDFGSFDNLDTAGDALADYTNVGDDNMGLDLVDDSAFGDAFHGTEMHHGETGDGDNA